MTKITELRNAFSQIVPQIQADQVEYYTNILNRLHADHGDTYGTGLSYRPRKDADHDEIDLHERTKTRLRIVGHFLTAADSSCRRGSPKKIRDQYLTETCREQAQAQVDSFVAKLEKKLSDLDSVELIDVRGAAFTIRGNLNGQSVHVNQQVIFKVSSRGTPFNQFPARIYVDNQFLSEKQFKAITL